LVPEVSGNPQRHETQSSLVYSNQKYNSNWYSNQDVTLKQIILVISYFRLLSGWSRFLTCSQRSGGHYGSLKSESVSNLYSDHGVLSDERAGLSASTWEQQICNLYNLSRYVCTLHKAPCKSRFCKSDYALSNLCYNASSDLQCVWNIQNWICA